jgi:hypothetical protein
MLSGNRIFDLAAKYTDSPSAAIIFVILIIAFRLLAKFGFFLIVAMLATKYVEVASSNVTIALFCTTVSSAYGFVFGGVANTEK